MCRTAGLECKQLEGHVKGVNYKLGDEISPDGTGSWATVLVDGIWRLIDVNWGARHVTGGDSRDWVLVDNNGERAKEVANEPSMMKYACNEAHFFADPYQFIYSHIPAEIEDWQLLARSVTLREFSELVYLKSAFFELGLRIVSHRKCTIETEEGEAELVIGLPEGGEQRRFMYEMWQSRGDENETLNVDSEFKRYVFMQQVAGELCCKIYFPKAGTFKLELFAQDSEKESGSYSLACAYIIHCSSPKQDCVPMPANDGKEWGPGNDLAQLGLTALTHKNGLIEVEDGQTQIRFKADKNVKIWAKLHSNTKDASELTNYVIHHQEDGEVVIDVKLPDSGEYALNLLGKDPSAEGSYSGLCSYLLRADTPAFDSTPFPEIANGELGATDKATDLHFEAVSHPTGFIEAPPSGQVDLTFQADPCEMTTTLILQTPDGPRPVARHVMYGQRSTGEIAMNVRFPESGLYALKVYAKSRDADGSSLPNVYNYVIKVATPMEHCEQFPEVGVAWSGRVDNEIIEPRNGTLVAKQTVEFVAKIPEAVDVATIGNSGWTHLTKEGDGLWKGAVDTGDGGHELTLNAMFEEGSNSYTNLLTYQVVSDNDLEELNERQQKDAIEAEIRREEEEELKKKREDDFKETRQGLLQAIEKQNIEKLRTAIKNVENKRYITRLQRDYNQAKKLLRSLVRIENLRHDVMDLDKKTIAEIRSYAHPPKLVHDVMRASLLLLGDHEGKTRKWEKCQPRCKTIGAKGLPSRVRKFCLDKVNPEIAARSKEILQHFRLDDVRDKSAGAAAFYVWVVGMAEELTILNGEDKVVTPATLPRQKEILAA